LDAITDITLKGEKTRGGGSVRRGKKSTFINNPLVVYSENGRRTTAGKGGPLQEKRKTRTMWKGDQGFSDDRCFKVKCQGNSAREEGFGKEKGQWGFQKPEKTGGPYG